MRNSLEQKFETSIQQLKTQQFDGYLVKEPSNSQPPSEQIIKTVKGLRTGDKALLRQKDELLFAYQTMEIAYQRYWEFFNFAPDGYLVTDSDGIIREANQTILTMLATKPADLVGKPIASLIPEIMNPGSGVQLNWFTGSQHLEVYLRTQGPEPLCASVSISPQCNIQNKPIGLLWLFRDITERKKTEEALLKSKTELSLILEKTPYVLWTADAALKLTSVSGASASAFHPSSKGIIGIDVSDYFGIENREILLKAHQSALSGLPQTLDFEWQGRMFQSTIEALKDTSDRIIGIIGAAFDITDRKQSEKTLQKSEKFNSNLLQNSPNPIAVINADSSIAYVNPAFEKLTGFSARKVLGQKPPYAWWIGDEMGENLQTFHKTLQKKKNRREILFRKKNGDHFWVDVTTILIENENEPDHHLQTWVDITEAKQLRENLEFYIMQITKAQEEERKRIAQELHEETVQSLAALCLATETIIRSKEKDPQATVRNLTELKQKISGVIEEVRRFSYGLRPGVLDYLGLTAALETLVEELNEKNIKVCFGCYRK